MLSDLRVTCPHEGCGWKGHLIPSKVPGGPPADILPMQRAWFRCESCGRDWSAKIAGESFLEVELGAEPSATQ